MEDQEIQKPEEVPEKLPRTEMTDAGMQYLLFDEEDTK